MQEAVSVHHGFENGVTNVMRFSVDAVVYGDRLSKNMQRQMLQPLQKSVLLIKEFMPKFLVQDSWCLTHLPRIM